MVALTIVFTRYVMYRDVMLNMKEKESSFGFQLQRILQIIDPWVFVDSKRDFYKAIVIFSVVTVFFAVGTTIGFSVDIICLLGGMIVLIMFSENVEEFIRSIDFPMLFFLGIRADDQCAFLLIDAAQIEQIGLLNKSVGTIRTGRHDIVRIKNSDGIRLQLFNESFAVLNKQIGINRQVFHFILCVLIHGLL